MDDLTDKQRAVFAYVLRYCREEGSQPSVRQIAEHFHFASPNAARDHLAALERKGYINRSGGAARSLEIAPEFLLPERGVPIVGQVAAGRPIEAIEHVDGYLDLDGLYARGRHFALRVRGDSMVDAGLWDGDYAIVRQQPRVESGEIGVAVVDGEATVKRFRWLSDGAVELCPENRQYQPLRIDPSQRSFSVAGRVVGLHRIL